MTACLACIGIVFVWYKLETSHPSQYATYRFARAHTPDELLRQHELVPDVLSSDGQLPSDFLVVIYPNVEPISSDAFMVPAAFTHPLPKVSWESEDALHTLIMLDADYPSRQNRNGNFLHWLVVDIPADGRGQGKTIVPYVGTMSMFGTGVHRILFLLYRQKGGKPLELDVTSMNRLAWLVEPWVKKHDLGPPLATAVFLTQWDTATDTLHDSARFRPKDGFMSPFEVLAASHLVPDVLNSTTMHHPSQFLTVTFRGAEPIAGKNASLHTRHMQESPEVAWVGDSAALYTLVWGCPDILDRGREGRLNLLHWVVVNIPGGHLHEGEVASSFHPPAPLFDRPERHYLLLFKQAGNERLTAQGGAAFPRYCGDLSAELGRHGLADPVAVAVWEGLWDETSSQVQQRWGLAPPPVEAQPPIQRMMHYGVVPDLFARTPGQSPAMLLRVKFDMGEVPEVVGTREDPVIANNTFIEPEVTWPAADGALYTLVLLDIDMPSRKTAAAATGLRSYVLWTVRNIPGDQVQSGFQEYRYMGPMVCYNTGLHRHVMLLYDQQGNRFPTSFMIFEGREKQDIEMNMKRVGLGDPVGFAMYLSEWDESVDDNQALHKYIPPDGMASPMMSGALQNTSAPVRYQLKHGIR